MKILLILPIDEYPKRSRKLRISVDRRGAALKPFSMASHKNLRSRFLYGLSDEEATSVLSKGKQLLFRRNSVAINQGHPAHNLYLLVRGRARFFITTHDGRKIILHWIVPGDLFGAATICAKPSLYLASVEMTQDSTVLIWTRGTITSLAGRSPQVLMNVVSVCQDYLDWYIGAHESLTSQRAGERLALLLIRLSESIGEPVPGGTRLVVSNEELANACNTTVFTVSRWMKKWQLVRAISKTRNRLVLRSKHLLLKNMAES